MVPVVWATHSPTVAKHQAVASSEAQVVPGVTAGGTTVDLGALLEPRR